jgi:ribosomal protein L11 methyltransferase
VLLAGLLDSQAEGLIAAYEAQGLSLAERRSGEWPVLLFRS